MRPIIAITLCILLTSCLKIPEWGIDLSIEGPPPEPGENNNRHSLSDWRNRYIAKNHYPQKVGTVHNDQCDTHGLQTRFYKVQNRSGSESFSVVIDRTYRKAPTRHMSLQDVSTKSLDPIVIAPREVISFNTINSCYYLGPKASSIKEGFRYKIKSVEKVAKIFENVTEKKASKNVKNIRIDSCASRCKESWCLEYPLLASLNVDEFKESTKHFNKLFKKQEVSIQDLHQSLGIENPGCSLNNFEKVDGVYKSSGSSCNFSTNVSNLVTVKGMFPDPIEVSVTTSKLSSNYHFEPALPISFSGDNTSLIAALDKKFEKKITSFEITKSGLYFASDNECMGLTF